jgi:hypothetical protein
MVGIVTSSYSNLELTMDDESLRDARDLPSPTAVKDSDRKSVLVLLGKKAIPEEREALLKIGTDFLDALRYP